jgi:hypothetical protein
MTAVVTGNTTSIGATQASAAAIETWAIAQGSVSASTAGSLTLAGIPIALDSATVFSGLAGASAVALGATLKVWAVNTDGAFSTWLATRVEAVVPTLTPTLITSGVVKQVSGNLTLNGYGLSGSRIVGLVAGLAVTVSGNLVGGALAVTSVHLLNSLPVIASGTVMEREGTVTALTSAGQFQMGVYPVDASAATVTPSTGVPALGSRVEVQGIWDGKTLVARAVEIKTQQRLQEVEVEASITQFTSVSDFVVRGLHCDASALTKIEGGSLADLKVGVKVHVHGLNMGSSVRLTELEIVK